MLKKKQAGMPVPRAGRAATAERRQSHGRAAPEHCQEKAASGRRRSQRKRIDGQGEMLLPIAGKKPKRWPRKARGTTKHRQKNVG